MDKIIYRLINYENVAAIIKTRLRLKTRILMFMLTYSEKYIGLATIRDDTHTRYEHSHTSGGEII